MDVVEALSVLGVVPGADASTVRDAYRRLIRASHPDVAGADRTAEAARVNEAYAVLVRARRSDAGDRTASARPAPSAPAAPSPTAAAAAALRQHEATLVLPWPPADAFGRVVEAGHALGEVTFIDRGAALVEVIVDVEGEACSFVCAFHRSGSTTTEVRCSLESIERVATLPAAPVVAVLAQFVRDAL